METILTAARAIRDDRLSPVDLVEACLDRIARLDDRLRAWVLVDAQGARRAAGELAREAAAGVFRGPLHGIPLAIKDIVDVAGWPTRAGSPLTDAAPAAQDATLVARLRAAGAILLGKTVTTEFASFDPPPTRNPFDLARTPGGSSSGSAAAVAAGMCLGAIGSQTGGSITRPASYCGVAGLKPTYARVSTAGLVPLAYQMDHPGPIGRTVGDLATLLAVIAGRDERDPVTSRRDVPDYVAAVTGGGSPPRLGVEEEFFRGTASAAVRAAFDAAVARLAGGATIVRATLPPSFADVVPMHRRVMAVEAADYHRRWFPAQRARYGPRIAELLDEGLACSAIDYAAAVRHMQRFRGEIAAALDGVDALLLPATTTTAPTAETTGDPRFNSPWSYSALPVASLPCGLAEDGLPVAVQLVGRAFDEAGLLSVAAWCERRLDFDARGLERRLPL